MLELLHRQWTMEQLQEHCASSHADFPGIYEYIYILFHSWKPSIQMKLIWM